MTLLLNPSNAEIEMSLHGKLFQLWRLGYGEGFGRFEFFEASFGRWDGIWPVIAGVMFFCRKTALQFC